MHNSQLVITRAEHNSSLTITVEFDDSVHDRLHLDAGNAQWTVSSFHARTMRFRESRKAIREVNRRLAESVNLWNTPCASGST